MRPIFLVFLFLATWSANACAQQTAIQEVVKINPTTAEIRYTDGKRLTADFYSDNIVRLFRDDKGGIVRNPAANPPASILCDRPRHNAGNISVNRTDNQFVVASNTISLSNPFGARWNPGGQGKTVHNGIDIPAERGTPVLAAADGTVTETGFDTERGNYLMIDHGDGLATLYAACSKVDVNEGDPVKAGTPIAAIGSTGRSTGPHLHFEVRQDGVPQNPTVYFDADVRSTLRMG